MKEHNMEYNTQKENLEIPEYGRNVQMLIKHGMSIEDPTYRQAFIEEVIELMLQMSPQNRNLEELRLKLWHQVFRITDYQIDVMPPNGEKPNPESRFKKPERVRYPEKTATYRHYGHNVQQLIRKALSMEPGPIRDGFVAVIGSYMKLAYKTWIKEHYVSDEIIISDLERLSGGKLTLPSGAFLDNLAPAKRQAKKSSSSHTSSSGNNKNRKKIPNRKKHKN